MTKKIFDNDKKFFFDTDKNVFLTMTKKLCYCWKNISNATQIWVMQPKIWVLLPKYG